MVNLALFRWIPRTLLRGSVSLPGSGKQKHCKPTGILAITDCRWSYTGSATEFYLPGDTVLLAILNFDLKQDFSEFFSRKKTGLDNRNYKVVDFLSGQSSGRWSSNASAFAFKIPAGSAQLLKLIPVNP